MYFIHDHLIAAVGKLHPGFIHGRDFLVLMGINPDGSPASDAWIERWPEGIPIPTRTDLIDAYEQVLADQAAAAPPVPSAPTTTTPLQFFDRFTEEEQLSIVAATMQAPHVKLWYDKLIAATEVVFADPRLSAGMDALVGAGLLTQARSEEILPLSARTTGMQQV